MFCLGGGGAGQKLQADIQIRRGTFKLRWGGPARAGLARPGPAREVPLIRAPRGPKHYYRYYAGRGGGVY